MKKIPMLNRFLSMALALALFVSSPVSVFADDDSNIAVAESVSDTITSEGTELAGQDAAAEGETALSEEPKSESEVTSEDVAQTDSDDSTSEDDLDSENDSENDEVNTDDARAGATVLEEDKDKKIVCEHSDFVYESNDDGTHKKICKECDEVVAESEPCEFDEKGKCTVCGYADPEHKFTLTDENGIVKVTGTKAVLNGATKVVAKEITGDENEAELEKMTDALDEEVAKENKSVVDFVAYDITLYDDNGDVVTINKDAGNVTVVFTQLEVEGIADSEKTTEVYHYADNTETVEQMTAKQISDDTVEMETSHFSTYLIAITGSNERALWSNDYVKVESVKGLGLNSATSFVDSPQKVSSVSNGKRTINITVHADGKEMVCPGENYVFKTSSSGNSSSRAVLRITPKEGYIIEKVTANEIFRYSDYNNENDKGKKENSEQLEGYLYQVSGSDTAKDVKIGIGKKDGSSFCPATKVHIYLSSSSLYDGKYGKATANLGHEVVESIYTPWNGTNGYKGYGLRVWYYKKGDYSNPIAFYPDNVTNPRNGGFAFNSNKVKVKLEEKKGYKIDGIYFGEEGSVNNQSKKINVNDSQTYDLTLSKDGQKNILMVVLDESKELEKYNVKVDLFDYEQYGHSSDLYWSSAEGINYVTSQKSTDKNNLLFTYGDYKTENDLRNKRVDKAVLYQGYNPYTGIADKELDENGMIAFSKYNTADLFSSNNRNGNRSEDSLNNKTYKWGYYDVEFPFVKDGDYLVFDSRYYSATFNESTNTVDIEKTDSDKEFWPLDNVRKSETDNGHNYHFGMHVTQNFSIPKSGQTSGDNPENYVFEFSGDDDVWVYIDGELVLDLGGIHQRIAGKIDFHDNTVVVTGNNSVVSNTKLAKKYNDGKIHEIQIYYLERGAVNSNCMIKFNLDVPEITDDPADVSFIKKDDLNNFVEGAKFELRDKNGNRVGDEVTSGNDGKVEFKEVPQGEYELVETYTPTKFAVPNHTWKVSIAAYGTEVKYQITANKPEDSQSVEHEDCKLIDDTYVIYNFTEQHETVTNVNKTAAIKNWDDRNYTIKLDALSYAETKTTYEETKPIDIILVVDTSGSMEFKSDLQKTSDVVLDKKETYYSIENSAQATVYRWKYEENEWIARDDHTGDVKDRNNINDYKNAGNLYEDTTGNTRNYYFKNAAKNLVDAIPNDSNISIVWFNGSVGIQQINGSDVATVSDSTKDSIKQAISNLEPAGGTRQDYGLAKAEELLDRNVYKNSNHDKKYVVLLTDGCPNASDTEAVVRDAVSTAKTIQNDYNTMIYAIGIDLEYNDYLVQARNLVRDCSSGEGYYFNHKASDLSSMIHTISNKISGVNEEKTISTGTVKDVVDARFDLLTDAEAKVTSSGTYTIGGRTAAVTVNADGTTTIVWNNQVLGTINDTQEIPWTASFTVKAKDDFLGGNVVPTNTSDSGVTVEGETTKFPEPSVNVKTLDLKINDGYEIKFLGETLDVYDEAKASEAIVKNVEATSPVEIKNVKVEKKNGKWTYTAEYSYKNTNNDVVGTITGELSSKTTDAFCDANHKATVTGEPVQEYTLKISYVPLTVTERNEKDVTKNLVKPVDTTKVAETEEVSGKYSIYVITSNLKLTKWGWNYVEGTELQKLDGAEFGLYKTGDNNQPEQVGTLQTTADGVLTFSNLEVGEFYIAETKAPTGYSKTGKQFTVKVEAVANDDASANGKQYKITVEGDKLDAYNTTKEKTVYEYVVTANVVKSNDTTAFTTVATLNGNEAAVETNVINYIAYTLPETGGRGVYVYTIGGILLMIAGLLLLYKNKKNKNK